MDTPLHGNHELKDAVSDQSHTRGAVKISLPAAHDMIVQKVAPILCHPWIEHDLEEEQSTKTLSHLALLDIFRSRN